MYRISDGISCSDCAIVGRTCGVVSAQFETNDKFYCPMVRSLWNFSSYNNKSLCVCVYGKCYITPFFFFKVRLCTASQPEEHYGNDWRWNNPLFSCTLFSFSLRFQENSKFCSFLLRSNQLYILYDQTCKIQFIWWTRSRVGSAQQHRCIQHIRIECRDVLWAHSS